jgi:2,3-bisphosphoglycerate-independent phosphoglycerate mutase
VTRLFLHAFSTGDTPPQSAATSIKTMEEKFTAVKRGRFASIIGRHYAMDRDHRWPRIQAAYDLMTQAKAEFTAASASQALDMAYARGETDEFVKATVISPPGVEPAHIADGDVIIFMNFRSDRARQITRLLHRQQLDAFERAVIPKLGAFVSLTEYNSNSTFRSRSAGAFAQCVGRHWQASRLHQLRIAETENTRT